MSLSPVETHSLCRLFMSLRRLSFRSSGAAQKTSDTVALVLFSHVMSHFTRQSHSKALPRKSLWNRTTVCHCRKACWEAATSEFIKQQKGKVITRRTHSSISESRSAKRSRGRALMLLFAKDLEAANEKENGIRKCLNGFHKQRLDHNSKHTSESNPWVLWRKTWT